MLAQELGLLRDRVESGGMRSELASLHARVEMLQREVGQALAGQQAGGGGEVAQRTLQMGQRDVLALVESEARARQAAEEALGSRVLSLPMHGYLEESVQDYIIDRVLAACA